MSFLKFHKMAITPMGVARLLETKSLAVRRKLQDDMIAGVEPGAICHICGMTATELMGGSQMCPVGTTCSPRPATVKRILIIDPRKYINDSSFNGWAGEEIFVDRDFEVQQELGSSVKAAELKDARNGEDRGLMRYSA